jgi:hypothetical protein
MGPVLKKGLLERMEAHFGADAKRIDHARRVLQAAEEIMAGFPAEPRIVVPAAILHDVGIKAAEEKYGSAEGHLQEKEGPPIARAILEALKTPADDIETICAIVAHHHSPGIIESREFAVVFDADCVVNLAETAGELEKAELGRRIDETLLTEPGKRLAKRTYGVGGS